MKKLFLAMLVVSLALTACGKTTAGTSVTVGPGAQGCQVWNQITAEWGDCSAGHDGLGGKIEAHPSLGEQYAGRTRVRIGGQVFWFKPEDLVTH